MNEKDVLRAVKLRTIANGCWCLFVDLEDGTGIKFYKTPEERDWAMIAQEYAAEVNCGPDVLGEFDMPSFLSDLEYFEIPHEWSEEETHGSTLYGYVTETVRVESIGVEEFRELSARLAEIGIYVHDSDVGLNVGYKSDGTPVLYDYDPHYSLKKTI